MMLHFALRRCVGDGPFDHCFDLSSRCTDRAELSRLSAGQMVIQQRLQVCWTGDAVLCICSSAKNRTGVKLG